VWGRSRSLLEALAQHYGVPAFQRFGELLPRCDALVFAVPPTVQAELAADAASAHKALLLEPMLGGDLAGAERLVVAAVQGHAVIELALTWRYAEAVRTFLAVQVPRTHPQGASGRLVSGMHAPGSAVSGWRRERGVLRDMGPHLLDVLDAALGPIADVRAHGEPDGWVGLLLEHGLGRFSEASMTATGAPGERRAEVEVFGPGGAAFIDAEAAVGPETLDTMLAEFADAVESGTSHALDVERGLHLQRVVDAAQTELMRLASAGSPAGR
jgi:predicted dehydrogenase